MLRTAFQSNDGAAVGPAGTSEPVSVWTTDSRVRDLSPAEIAPVGMPRRGTMSETPGVQDLRCTRGKCSQNGRGQADRDKVAPRV